MENRNEEEELDLLLGEITFAESPILRDNRSYLLHQQLPRRNNSSVNAIQTLTGPSLESAFGRLNLSTAASSQQSSFRSIVPRGYDGVIGNPMTNSTSIGQGLLHLSFQQMQQNTIDLHRLRLQDAVMGQTTAFMRGTPTLRAETSNSFPLNRSTSTFLSREGEVKAAASVTSFENGYREPFYNCYSRNQSCFKLKRPSPRESINCFLTRPCSNGNGFHLDSEAHCGGGVINGSLFESENSNADQNPYCNRHFQQYLSLEELRGHILEVAKDQRGCRFLQKKFEEGNEEDIKMIFSEVKDHANQLMVDPFGNYLVQKLIEVCNVEQRTEILHAVTREEFELVTICLNPYGTRAVQKLLEHLTTPQQISRVMSALRRGAVTLTNNTNGHHYLLNAVADHSVEIATDRSGCCVLQQCLAHAKGEPRERLIAEITENALLLSQDPFGNYVVQYILDMHIPNVTENILNQLHGSFVSLSLQKFGSHVVEKCLKYSGVEQSTRIIRELLNSRDFFMLPQHEYGNYVVQSALMVSKGHIRSALIASLVQMHFPSMCSSPYGKWIMQWINANK
ncbi:PREDICTED: pumilio homolog 12-like [Nelumbo nucifera]|uniref:Pumilio homolog 12-like n=1 Tax=Nelumbo nucifera TaxID=4432 RepID=A0A1U8BBK9_NELNU|nr:PREDICTED: pumilio homolog 12-like [Nelumbo nucifera]